MVGGKGQQPYQAMVVGGGVGVVVVVHTEEQMARRPYQKGADRLMVGARWRIEGPAGKVSHRALTHSSTDGERLRETL